jgi:glycosyltransferase involved in cell wall biosynthesis
LHKSRVLIFIVCYNHERFIVSVLDRIPKSIWENELFDTEILIIDDKSSDNTFDVAREYANHEDHLKITVLYNPINLGYGGNQKIGYQYAINNGFDVVVLLHGDGQYPPEFLEQMILPIVNRECDVVLGSRMMDKKLALSGKMPLYKWFGNIILTVLQNLILGVKLAEFHTGYKSYSIAALKSIPFEFDSDYFDFDTDILIQLFDTENHVKEIPIPTFYGEEISRVNVIKYGYKILLSSINSRLMKMGIFYHPKFDYAKENTYYTIKVGYPSSHQYAIDHIKPNSSVLDIGSGPGYMAEQLLNLSVKVLSVDRSINDITRKYSFKTIQTDVELLDFEPLPPVDTILLLDIIEHLRSPEQFLKKLRTRYCKESPDIIISTANVAFLPIRFMFLLGQFNYGKRGILDLDHTHLYTFKSLKRSLINQGFEILNEQGLPAPFPLIFKNRRFSLFLIKINLFFIKLSKGLFSYQIVFIIRPKPTVELLLSNAKLVREEKILYDSKKD